MASRTQTAEAATAFRLYQSLNRAPAALAIALLGLFPRIAFLFAIRQQPLLSDAAGYTRMATLLVHHQAFIPFWPPGTPLYLAWIHQLFGDSVPVMRAAMLPFYLGLCVVLYGFTRELTGSRCAGAISLIPLALAPAMVFFSVEPTTELPSAFFLTLAALAFLRLTRAFSLSPLLLLSVALGSLALLRPASLIFLAAVPLYLLANGKGIVRSFAPVLIPLIMVFAWILRVQQTTGRIIWINTANAKNLYIGNNPNTPIYRTWWLGSHHALEDAALPVHPSDPVELEREYSLVAKNYILAHPALFVLRTFNRVCVFFAPDTFPGAYLTESYGFPRLLGLFVIAVDGLVFAAVALSSSLFFFTRSRERGLLLGIVILYAAPYFIAFSHPRYHFPIEPLLYAAAAAFLAHPVSNLARLPRRKASIVATAAIFLLIQVEFLVVVARAR
jgi:4-amino-4-deoxy-L-arabinose transferase-like glycosyltransferase